MVGRATKTLLVLIAVALWGLLLRPLLSTTPAQAQSPARHNNIALSADNSYVYVLEEGSLSVFRLSREAVMKNGALVTTDQGPLGISQMRRVDGPQPLQAIKPFDESIKSIDWARVLWEQQQREKNKARGGRAF